MGNALGSGFEITPERYSNFENLDASPFRRSLRDYINSELQE